MKFRLSYFGITVLLFVVEVLIALFVRDAFVRPYVGDYLVVMLVYFFVQSFWVVKVWPAAIGVLLFAYAVEVMQYVNVLAWFGWEQHNVVRIVMGHSFEWFDMLAYTLGVATVVYVEKSVHHAP